VIGDSWLISKVVSLISSGREFRDRSRRIEEQGIPERKRIRIRDEVWIGAMFTVPPGISIRTGGAGGKRSVGGARRLSCTIVVGNPARVVEERS
jgi:acetyltransferase-like isoleucine patch superfamily enzyme